MLSVGKKSYWANVRPGAAIADLREVYRQAGANRWRIALAALAVTTTLFWPLISPTWRARPPRPKVIYINSFPENQTAAEIKAFTEKTQTKVDKIRAQEAAADKLERDMYKAIGRASGMDVDAIEKQAQADAKASEAAKAAAMQKQAQGPAAPQAPVGKR